MPDWLRDVESRDIGTPIPDDDEKMRYVVRLAKENVERKTGGPFAAAVFDSGDGRLTATGVNVVVSCGQSWAHAEMTAMAHAQNLLGKRSLDGCVLVSSCEPCAMCTGAIPWGGVNRVIFAATREMAEAGGFDEGYRGAEWRTELERRGIGVSGPMPDQEADVPFAAYVKGGGAVY